MTPKATGLNNIQMMMINHHNGVSGGVGIITVVNVSGFGFSTVVDVSGFRKHRSSVKKK